MRVTRVARAVQKSDVIISPKNQNTIMSSSAVGPAPALELSVIMPCLNEARTLGECIKQAQKAIADHNLSAEVVVADNGSTDGSQEIASRLGARVIHVTQRGYGAALMGGIE